MTRQKAPKPALCPICRKPAEEAFRPFCSQRCADVDLGRWLGERYVNPGPDEDVDSFPRDPDDRT